MHVPRATLICAVALTSTFATAPVLAERDAAAQKPLQQPAAVPASHEQPEQLQPHQEQQEQQEQLQQEQQQQQGRQKPLLASWFAKVASYLPESLSRAITTTGDKKDDDDDAAATSDAASVAAAAASAVVRLKKIDLPRLTLDNWKTVLRPSSTAASGPGEPEEWWILVTGRNKTCHGDCEPVETAFNVCGFSLSYLFLSLSLSLSLSVSLYLFLRALRFAMSVSIRRRGKIELEIVRSVRGEPRMKNCTDR